MPDADFDPADIDPADVDWKATAENLQQEVDRLRRVVDQVPENVVDLIVERDALRDRIEAARYFIPAIEAEASAAARPGQMDQLEKIAARMREALGEEASNG